jgi:L-amino acid N-acyltransferase YncA
VLIRPYLPDDWNSVWAMLEPVFRAGDTYAVPQDVSAEAAKELWTGGGKQVFVGVDGTTGQLLGTYYLKPNCAGPGSHVCNCGYVVSEQARAVGLGSRLCEHSQAEAVSRGFRAMQYNLVVATNEHAVRLRLRMGFRIVGTLPQAFRHPEFGFVDAHVMYKLLG